MKIKHTDLAETLASRSRGLRDQSAQELLKKRAQRNTDEDGRGTVELSLGKAINQELNAESLAAERQAKVEDLKRRIQGGEYQQPSSNVLAQSVGEELAYEILTGRSSTE